MAGALPAVAAFSYHSAALARSISTPRPRSYMRPTSYMALTLPSRASASCCSKRCTWTQSELSARAAGALASSNTTRRKKKKGEVNDVFMVLTWLWASLTIT